MKIFTKILAAGMLMVGLLGVFTPAVSAANGINICSNGNEVKRKSVYKYKKCSFTIDGSRFYRENNMNLL